MRKPKAIKFTKTEVKLMAQLQIGNSDAIVSNPFSGEQVKLEPLGIALYDFIRGCEVFISNGHTKLVKDFDTARNVFRKQFPDEYMKLID